MDLVKEFADKNYLKLNTQKCEIVTFDRGRKESIVAPNCEVDGVDIYPQVVQGNVWDFGGVVIWKQSVLFKKI